jgi:hypothetical protein
MDLPLWRGGADGPGNGDGGYFRDPNETDVDGSRWRRDVGKCGRDEMLLEEYRIADWSIEEDSELG